MLWLAFAGTLAGQQTPLDPRQYRQVATRGTQLMESTSAAIPEMLRAAAPLIENAKQAVASFNSPQIAADDSRVFYSYLTNLRAYLLLLETVPKPYPFPEEAFKQITELRNAALVAEQGFRLLLETKERAARGPDRDQLERYREANQKVAPAADGRRVVFLGDSITDGWRLNEYFPDRDFVNRGISGQITSQMLARMKADVLDLKPAAVIILAGTNDIARGVPLEVIQNNLTMIANLADAAKIKVLLCSVLPISDYHRSQDPRWEMSKVRPPAQIKQLNEWMQGFAKQRGFAYVDYYAATVDANGMLKVELADDGLHPNGAGYRAMAPVALAAIDKVLPPRAATPQRKRR
ncbi:MAG: SGNH/GDSL hydrolase family protein [Bryobacteraceae bacterium]|nr:SGNH/GDSL hydrolase family protein [Bryobacteraceae bacterium]